MVLSEYAFKSEYCKHSDYNNFTVIILMQWQNTMSCIKVQVRV